MLTVTERLRNNQRMAIESAVQYQLNAILESVKANPKLYDVSACQAMYGGQVDAILRKGAALAYDLGADYVDNKFNFFGVLEEEIAQETEAVQDIVTIYSVKFWRKVATLLGRNDILLQKYDYEPRSPLSSNYMATSTAIGLVTRSLAKGTIFKLKELERIREPIIIKSGLASPRVSPTQLGKGERDETKDQFVWDAVMDGNTCSTCEELHEQYFDYDDPDIPEPADVCEGKDNCRCVLNIVEATSAIIYSDEEDLLDEDEEF